MASAAQVVVLSAWQDVHGFGIVVLGQAIWFMVAGKRLWGGQNNKQPLPA